MIHLTVSRPFDKYKKGHIIMDPAEMAEVQAGHNAHDVVQVISKDEHRSGAFWKRDDEVEVKKAKA